MVMGKVLALYAYYNFIGNRHTAIYDSSQQFKTIYEHLQSLEGKYYYAEAAETIYNHWKEIYKHLDNFIAG